VQQLELLLGQELVLEQLLELLERLVQLGLVQLELVQLELRLALELVPHCLLVVFELMDPYSFLYIYLILMVIIILFKIFCNLIFLLLQI
jgi:hypothetical protein